jgi:hypothetical protein
LIIGLFPSHVRFVSKSGSGTVIHSVSGSAKAKNYGSCGSGSTTLMKSVEVTKQIKSRLSKK